MPLYTSTGAFNVAVNDTTGTGRYSASGALRINLVTGSSYVGLYAADGALNVVDVGSANINTYGGLYHPSGAIRGRTAPTTYSGIQAPDGSYYFNGLFTPLSLFAAGEQGAWYDPSDFSTMFQNSTGTIPVTAVEQPVGKILDKSGRGNHATQSTAGSQPVLSARVNQLTYSEQFDNAAWTKAAGVTTVTANAVAAPNGTQTADLLTSGAGDGYAYQTVTLVAGVTYTFSVWLKAQSPSSFSTFLQIFNASDAGTTQTITVTSDWQMFSLTKTVTQSSSYLIIVGGSSTLSNENVYAWGADLRVTNVGVNLPAYQRVAAATDYDSGSEWPRYLKFDGVDDSLATETIDFTATDKMSVFAGVRKISTSDSVVVELSANTTINNGTFILLAPGNTIAGAPYNNYSSYLRGTNATGVHAATYTSPITNTVAFSYDIAAASALTEIVPRVNSATPSSVTVSGYTAANAGTGNFGNYPLYIGRRGGSTIPFNGNIYALIVRGAQSTDAQIASTETWVNGRTRAF